MPSYSFGDVVVLPFSYTDLRSEKRRPALVLLDSGDGDILVARITSKISASPYDVIIGGWKEVGLIVPSNVRLHKLLTIEKDHVIKKLGKLSADDLKKIRDIFRKIII